jgi:MATE family multidrug resistance protein
MEQSIDIYKKEAWSLGKLALPLILTSLVSMGLAVTDVIMMNWLGTAELAAGAATSDYYSIIYYFFGGIIAAMAPLLSQARGAKQDDDVREFTRHGLLLALLLSLPGAFIVWHSPLVLDLIGVDHNVVLLAYDYAHMMSLTFIFMVCSVTFHDFLAAHERTRIIFYISAIGLPLNALGNYAFMFGNFGLPEMGLGGAGLSSAVVSAVMFLAYIYYISTHKEFSHYQLLSAQWRFNGQRILAIVRVGLPIGVATIGELGVYLLSTVVIGVFGVEALAAHALALRMAGVIYAVPLGMSQATTVRSGLATGANDHQAFKTTSRTALSIAISVGLIYLFSIGLFRNEIAEGFFLDDSVTILTLAATLLGILAVIQPFESVATVSNGILRGIKDTRVPMIISLVVFWGFGVAGGWSLAFYYKMEATGIWLGLLAASFCYFIAIFSRYRYSTRFHLVKEQEK